MSALCCAQAECIQHGLRTIAFCHTRKLCELVTAYTRETLKSSAPHLSSSISVYRAGYSPEVSFGVPTDNQQRIRAPGSAHESLVATLVASSRDCQHAAVSGDFAHFRVRHVPWCAVLLS